MATDLKQRQQALDPARSFIVQAPAGSGKTEVLTQRFLTLLARVDQPERVLAITFTRKATQEMRTRIMRRLGQAQAGEQAEAAHDQAAIALAAQVLQRDQHLGWNLLRNPGRLRITTIDGLCMQLLARDPVRGPQWSGIRVLEGAEPLYRQAVRALFADIDALAAERTPDTTARKAQAALVNLLVERGGDVARLEQALVDMLRQRSLWDRHLVTSPQALQALLAHRQAVALEIFSQRLGAHQVHEAVGLVQSMGLDVSPVNQDIASRLEAMVTFARVFCTNSGSPRAPGGIRASLFPNGGDNKAPGITRLREIYTGWNDNPEALDEILRMAHSPPLDSDAAAVQARLDDTRAVLSLALVELQTLMAEQGVADFTAVSTAALDALGEDTQPGDTLLAEDGRIDHILMDEFQDTSHAQFGLLERLISGWQPDDGRSLFLVGDPMQSIYRFREANVGFFNTIVEAGSLGPVEVAPLTLTANFRSAPELIDWFNQTFAAVFPSVDESDSGAVSYTPVTAACEPGGKVTTHAIADTDAGQAHEDRVAELAIEALEDPANQSVAILVRARSHVTLLASALQQRGVEFEAVSMELVTNRPVVRDLLAITRALMHPLDRVAWLALLRAPWCGLVLQDLHIAVGEDPEVDVLESLRQCLEEEALSGDAAQRASQVLAIMTRARAMTSTDSLSDRVEWCWNRLGGPDCCARASDAEDARVFLAMVEETESEGRQQLVERLEEKLASLYAASHPARLKIMTIHAAKGLEFDAVILPNLHRGSGNSDAPLMAVQEFAGPDDGAGVLMAPWRVTGESDFTLYDYLKQINAERGRYEDQRVLYVACTRARRRLDLVATIKFNSNGRASIRKGTFLEALRAPFTDAIETLAGSVAETAAQASAESGSPVDFPLLRMKQPIPPVAPVDAPTGEEPATLRALPDRQSVALGLVLHEWLELIHDHPQPAWDEARIRESSASIRSSLVRAGATSDSLDELHQRCMQALLAAVGEEGVMSQLPADRAASWSELALYRKDGARLSRHVIDLLVQDGDGALRIFDFKSGQSSEADAAVVAGWEKQLGRYRGLVEKALDGPVVETRILKLEGDEPAR